MTNVVNLTPELGEYPAPDFQVIAQSTKDISRLPFFRSDSMKALQDKAKIVSDYALELSDMIGQELVSLSSSVGNLGLSDSFAALTEIDNELAKGLDPETTKAAHEARSDVVNGISTTLSGTAKAFSSAAERLRSKEASISNFVIAERTGASLTKHQARNEALVQSIAAKQDDQKKLQTERDAIIASQDVIREKNIADIYQDYIPDAKSLEKLDLKKPEVEAIKQGVELLKKILGNVSEGFKYIDLANARQEIERKMDAVVGEIRDLQASLAANDDILSDLGNVTTIDAKRALLLAESNKLPTACTTFVDQITHLDGSEITEANVTALTDNMKNYLDACTTARNKVIVT